MSDMKTKKSLLSMKKSMYITPLVETTEIELHPLLEPSITATGGDANVVKADPDEPIPTTADSRRKDIWADPEEDEELY